jgi:GNAT superfamily N-acetyltransferase
MLLVIAIAVALTYFVQERINSDGATQSTAVTEQRLAAGIPYVDKFDSGIIETISYYPTTPNDSKEPSFYKNNAIGHFGQFAVAPEMQKHGLGNKLVQLIEAHAVPVGKRELACDSAEGTTQLIDYKKRRGYRSVRYHQWPHACYRSLILSKILVHV